MADRLDTPRDRKRSWFDRRGENRSADSFGRGAEAIARFMGTPRFLVWMTLFCILWLAWNSLVPPELQFDKEEYGFTVLTLALSLQASYAAPLILLAQNRQDDRDRVTADRDRIQAQRNLADTEYLAREVAALRIALQEVATRDFVRGEFRNFLEELDRARPAPAGLEPPAEAPDGAAQPDQSKIGDPTAPASPTAAAAGAGTGGTASSTEQKKDAGSERTASSVKNESGTA
ncbi:MAG: DUF1003 domain-containing protein, partial [Bifidobacteriaceae bacterium]|nr:DUF1003 domain-containing protein [Bifidobacteriaceae bacterium]